MPLSGTALRNYRTGQNKIYLSKRGIDIYKR